MSAGALPRPLAALLGALPERPPAQALATLLNVALAAGVLDRELLGPLVGRTVRIQLADSKHGVQLRWEAGRFRAAPAGPADATIRARAAELVALALGREDPDTLFFSRRLMIEGEVELGLVVKNALAAARLPGR